MVRWRNACHAYAYSTILGRIAGFDEARIEQLIQNGKVEGIVAAIVDVIRLHQSARRKVA